MAISDDQRPRCSDLALTTLLAAALAGGVGMSTSVLAQQPIATPQTFHTTARFSVDSDVLRLQTAVAISELHGRSKEFSWVRIYFYAFPLTADDVAGLSTGSIAALEHKWTQAAAGGPDRNHSRAVLHFLLDRDSKLSNVSLEVPGLTCTIVEQPAAARNAVQTYQLERRQLHVKAKGASVCDLTSVNGGKRAIGWDVDVNIPVFAQR